jgi:hypothetical protein
MSDMYSERMATAKAIAESVVAACAQYAAAPSQNALNQFLSGIESLAGIAEDIEVARTVAALDA